MGKEAKRQAWLDKTRALKRLQKYIGIRPKGCIQLVVSPSIAHRTLHPLANATIVALDFEAVLGTKDISELGISYLDLQQVQSTPPGETGKNWHRLIHSRHFIVGNEEDTKALRARKAMEAGDPLGFNFGQSEFVTIQKLTSELMQLFGGSRGSSDCHKCDIQCRNLVLLVHSVQAERDFLRDLGFDMNSLPHVKDTIDTQALDEAHRREVIRSSHARKLHQLLDNVAFPYANLHNAGNDAHYTIQAALAVAFQSAVDGIDIEMNAGAPEEGNSRWITQDDGGTCVEDVVVDRGQVETGSWAGMRGTQWGLFFMFVCVALLVMVILKKLGHHTSSL